MCLQRWILSLLLLGSLGSASINSCFARDNVRPNVILIMADDLGYETLGCNGSVVYKTPHLDRLAAEGIRFTQSYSTPLCTPSRVQMMTGEYNFRNYTEFGSLKPGEGTFAHVAKDAGYATCVVGKWQLAGRIEGAGYRGEGTLPEEAGFDEHCLWQVQERGSRYWDPVIRENGKIREDLNGRFGPDVFVEYISGFLERRRDQQPFFLYYPMALTHDPFVHTPKSEGTVEEIQHLDRWRVHPRFFPDFVHYADHLVGQILEKLEQAGLAQKTIVIFTTDNGTHPAIESDLMGRKVRGAKGQMTDGGTHVPMIVRWAGTSPEGLVCEDLIDFSDFLPTIAEAVGAPVPETSDGRSFFPRLLGEAGNPRDWIYCHYDPRWGKFEPGRFARNRRWKLYGDRRFFDLAVDPREEHPIEADSLTGAARSAHEELHAVLEQYPSLQRANGKTR